jgi:hypothetical protein
LTIVLNQDVGCFVAVADLDLSSIFCNRTVAYCIYDKGGFNIHIDMNGSPVILGEIEAD